MGRIYSVARLFVKKFPPKLLNFILSAMGATRFNQTGRLSIVMQRPHLLLVTAGRQISGDHPNAVITVVELLIPVEGYNLSVHLSPLRSGEA